MTARALDVTTFVLPPASASNPTLQPIQANASVAFELDSYSAIQTLSSNLFNISPDQVQGLLYVPSLALTDPCYNITAPFVPNNATRRANIPTTTYTAIAIAPWYDVQCTRAYLNAAMQDIDFLRGIIFFQTNDTSNSQPPPVSDAEWDLDDGGQWKSNLEVPAYAIPGPMGKMLMTELSLYSGNVSTAPNGQALAQDFGESGMPRLYAAAVINSGPSLPSLWVFLIIVLGILLVIVTGSSLFMGFVQRRRRAALRRRVENGEVDLEALGIKRMTIPQSLLDKMPLYTFKGESAAAGDGLPASKEIDKTGAVPTSNESSQIQAETPLPAPTPIPAQNGQYFSQTTCTICLDDFVSNETNVRELPCHHIFHPECVDPFLLEHSSACPVCKKSTLPDGFCPESITNAMVRREQLIRRIQDRRGSRAARRAGAVNTNQRTQTSQQDLESQSTPPPTTLLGRIAGLRETLNRGIHHRHETQSVTISPPPETTQAQPAVEMNSLEPPPTVPNTDNRASVMALQSESDPARRRELARQRAIANIDRQNAEREQAIETEGRRLPIWRRAIGRVFPALTT